MNAVIMTLKIRHTELNSQLSKFKNTDPYYSYLKKEISQFEDAIEILNTSEKTEAKRGK